MIRSMVLAAQDGVQRAEHQVARFGRGHGQADGFQVAHFAHQDGVRVFAQGGLQGREKTASWARLRAG